MTLCMVPVVTITQSASMMTSIACFGNSIMKCSLLMSSGKRVLLNVNKSTFLNNKQSVCVQRRKLKLLTYLHGQ